MTQAQAQLAVASSATAAARARLDQAVLSAPADARVLARLVEPGQIVQPGRALLSLALAGPLLLTRPEQAAPKTNKSDNRSVGG